MTTQITKSAGVKFEANMIEKTVCSKLHNRFCGYFKINDLVDYECVVF